jgi:hypothetical protein
MPQEVIKPLEHTASVASRRAMRDGVLASSWKCARTPPTAVALVEIDDGLRTQRAEARTGAAVRGGAPGNRQVTPGRSRFHHSPS